ncbi:ABC transporter ATP-binding protein [Acidobacterium capsulatum]|uniref:Efflux ABC transporter, permease/ATP-binding protein n=1 Tax=Acidobacterium capsulatum (strain ATCC 51196 / DSM 11244 / BCRC 80197 / JCM 7670 / NBRC 15755 / NCIMB 13165 / 161) TaxID=240015 RepID=C1F1L7_ACIC5|nr:MULTISPECIES: ABC transporter transmembrane domain-containing protein [Acidobacterium]ACO33282.1 efflux ABC transporter, permease/ATP-binding protein [Acidobacterium capsulatum ATCC 51196]HCT61362.1 multidrug ABC transporter ATP-binding protein [Acidobacterium sp.]
MKRLFRLLSYARHYLVYAFAAVVLAAGVGLFDAFRVLLVGPIFDDVLHPGGNSGNRQISLISQAGSHFHIHLTLQQFVPSGLHNDWNMVAYALVLSTLLKGICDYGGTYLASYAGYGTITDLRDDLYEAILRRSVSFFQKHATGTLLSALINDIERVQYAMATILSDFLQQFFTLIFMLYVVIALGGKLAWILLIFVPVVFASMRRIGRGVRKTTRKGQDKLAEIQNILHETITGNRIVKAFNMEFWELIRFRKAARRLLRANMRTVSAQALSSPLMDVIGAIAIALLLRVGHSSINHHSMQPGQFLAFIVALFKLYDPIRRFAVYYNSFQQALGSSQAIFDFIDDEDRVVEKPHAHKLKPFKEGIVLDHVSFRYQDEEGVKEVLHEIDLTIRRGEVLALVGPSGAGKTTLVNLIPRFFDVTSGRILIDGHDLRDVTLSSLREQIGKVTQETILFNDTVRNNIAYGQPDVPLARVVEAARAALAHEFIEAMPEGYDTIIGEKGFRLSGGQRQRLAIARAILKNAPILILDEATSALDAESESLVQAALANLMTDRTSIVIAHRLSTVRRADRIAVLEQGRITAIGSHEELLLSSPTYQKLHRLQFMDIDHKNDFDFVAREAAE